MKKYLKIFLNFLIFGLTIVFHNSVLAQTVTPSPLITSIDPMNGAPGNWVTIVGKDFGLNPGIVEFATDLNKNLKYDADEWIGAKIVSCNGGSSWAANSVIVEVPQKGEYILNNTAALFNGVDGRAEITDEKLNFTNMVTFEAWIKPTDSGAYKTILSKVNPTTKQGYFLALNNLEPAVYLSGLKNPGWHLAGDKVLLNTWSHIVATYDGTSIKFYINGVLNRTTPMSGSLVSIPGKKLWIGMREDFPTINQFKGWLDEITLYNTVLTSAQITAHYAEAQKVSGGTYETLVNKSKPLGYWRLDETSGTTVAENSAHTINGAYLGGFKLNQIGIFGPDIKKSGIGEKSAIRITVSSTVEGKVMQFSDSTIDEFGSKPNNDGLFVLSTTQTAGLCPTPPPVIVVQPPPDPLAPIPGAISLFFQDIGQRLQLLFTIDPVKDAQKRLEFANTNLELAKTIITATDDPTLESRADNLVARANELITTVNEDSQKWSRFGNGPAIATLLDKSRTYIETSKTLINSISEKVTNEHKAPLNDLVNKLTTQNEVLVTFIHQTYPEQLQQIIVSPPPPPRKETKIVRPAVVKDRDRDGIDDDSEKELGTESNDFDTDADGLSDRAEIERYGTDPNKDDTDADGYRDGLEVLKGFNPIGTGVLTSTKPTSTKLKFLNTVKIKTDISSTTLQYINFVLENYKK